MIGSTEAISKLKGVVRQFNGRRILVVGDLEVNKYVFGEVKNVSPEAPVPMMDYAEEVWKPGGAMLIADSIVDLGGEAHVIGVVGNDPEGDWLASRVNSSLRGQLVRCPGRPTSSVTRYFAREQQIFRMNRENRSLIERQIEAQLSELIGSEVSSCEGVVVADYEKGTVTPKIVSALVSNCKALGTFVMADARSGNMFNYLGVDFLRTNESYASRAVGVPIINETSIRIAGMKLAALLGCNVLFISRGKAGITVFEKAGQTFTIPATSHVLKDKTGVGDVVTATLALAIAAKASHEEAAILGSHTGGIKVQKIGTQTVSIGELERFIAERGS